MYVFSVIHRARGDTQASAWSRALTTVGHVRIAQSHQWRLTLS